MNLSRVYFPNLNGLRFIAAFLVLIHHMEQAKIAHGLEHYYFVPFVYLIGKLGVILFFVLSGFLITYLLMAEETVFSKISIRRFYIRRLLRIWPLYFLIIGLALFVFPYVDLFIHPEIDVTAIHSDLGSKILLFILFMPNVLACIYGIIPFASHTWSIGVEEQFYLFWPLVIRMFKKNRLILMLLIIVFHFVIRAALSLPITDFIPYKENVKVFWSLFNINCMAIGGLYAVILFKELPVLKYLLNKKLFYIVLVATVLLLVKGVHIPLLHYETYATLFGLIILNFAWNKELDFSLENKVFNYLGNISYGIYMYHLIGVVLAIQLGKYLEITTNWLLYPTSMIITIVISSLSYTYFEKYFLKYKNRFAKVRSGVDAHESMKTA